GLPHRGAPAAARLRHQALHRGARRAEGEGRGADQRDDRTARLSFFVRTGRRSPPHSSPRTVHSAAMARLSGPLALLLLLLAACGGSDADADGGGTDAAVDAAADVEAPDSTPVDDAGPD